MSKTIRHCAQKHARSISVSVDLIRPAQGHELLLSGVFFIDHYSDDSSAVHGFTSLGCLKEDFARFNRGIVTMGQDTDVELRVVKCGFGCLVIEANKLRDARLWRS